MSPDDTLRPAAGYGKYMMSNLDEIRKWVGRETTGDAICVFGRWEI